MRSRIDKILATRPSVKRSTAKSPLVARTYAGGPPRPSVPLPTTQYLFIRSDPLDGLVLPLPQPFLMDGKGASATFSSNQLTNQQSLAINSYVAVRGDRIDSGNTSFGYATFVYANGSLANPQKPTSERNALQAGLDFQLAQSSDDLQFTILAGVRPYYQTDFRGYAQIAGLSAVAEPYVSESLHLGGRPSRVIEGPQYVAWYWRLLPEFNYFHVDDPGRTSFRRDTDYTFLGGTVQLRTLLFDGIGPSWLSSRFYANGSVTQFWDLSNSSRGLHDAQAEFGYIIAKGFPIETGIPLTATISAVYNNGVNRLTFVKRDEYKIQLNLQY